MPDSPLDSYREKRNFENTPEPPARKRRGRSRKQPAFVIHRHDARKLHYDLRLEMDGVLKSWAVPKGFSYDPKDKHFAVHTEDHPMEYEDFHGVIPSGQYGAGPMTIWDRGTFELLESDDGVQAIADGKIELRFDGGRLRGEWHMVKLKDEKKGWLLFKAKDRYSRTSGESVFAVDIHTTQRSGFPRGRKPMLPGREHDGVLSETGFLYEPQLAGVRVFAEKKQDVIRFRATSGKFITDAAPRAANQMLRLRAENALLDGVLVCVNEQGRPDKPLAEQVVKGSATGDLVFYAFDVLYYDAWDVREFPLSERKAALASLIPHDAMLLQFVQHERARPDALMEAIQSIGLAGAIAKHADSKYVHGSSNDWVTVHPAEGNATSKPRAQGRVKFTNRSKVLWSNNGYTKGDLIDYYACVADVMVPYLADRPLSLKRFPDGIEGKTFFQKGAPKHAPDWIRTQVMESSNKEGSVNYIICDERDTLLYLANLAAIELHPWQSRCAEPLKPDWAIIDLDPYGVEFHQVTAIAKTIGEILHAADVVAFPKTSGSKGLHIYLPLTADYSYDHVRQFCEVIARLVVTKHRGLATVERQRSARVGQVYIDFMQNRRGQTVCAPYSVRPVPGACVSAPLMWEELTLDLHPSQFTIHTVPDRLSEHGDLFSGALDEPQDLLEIIDAIRG